MPPPLGEPGIEDFTDSDDRFERGAGLLDTVDVVAGCHNYVDVIQVDEQASAPPNNERQWLLQADHAASRDFDKAVMTLAAGALGVSIAFVHDLAPDPVHVTWLGWAWGLFALSLVLILVSFLTSQLALRREMKVLSGERSDARPGGPLGPLTIGLNWGSAGALVSGVIALVVFALYNRGGR
jgi:hypothetical protein